MTTPSNRVPVRIGRGTKANLDTAIAAGDLKEGEICYATDENTLYLIEGGVLTATSVDLTAINIVDDTTPQLGGNLDVNGFEVVSTAAGNIVLAPDTTGVVEIKGNGANDAAIQLNCGTGDHGIKLKSPPHNAAASYTLTFPSDTGTTGQALTTDGSGGLSWATAGAVDSVNTQTGAVSLGVEDLDDFELNPTTDTQRTWIYTATSESNPASGVISNWTGTSWMVNVTDNNGDDASILQSQSTTQNVTVFVDGVSTYVGTMLQWANQNGTRAGFQFGSDTWKSSLVGGEEITLDMAIFASGSQPLADGDILQYVSADSKFKPALFTAASTRTLLGIGEYADDTAAGTGGVSSGALYYNTTNSNYVLKT